MSGGKFSSSSGALRVEVTGIAVCATGLPDWPSTVAILRRERPFAPAPLRMLAPAVLAPGERRRASLAVRLAIECALGAVTDAQVNAADLLAVFGSSDGDGDTIHSICAAVATPGYPVSPSRFHNSVHNAPAGYWSIGVGARRPSTSICAYDDTAAVALLDAASQAHTDRSDVLLVVSDVVGPASINRIPPVEFSFGSAFVFGVSARRKGRPLEISYEPGTAPFDWPDDLPESMARNPAARIMPLLRALSDPTPADVRMAYGPAAHLLIRVGA